MLGLAAIVVGWLVAPEGDRLPYLAAVLGGAGTTLLLVGFVVLLERRIVDNAVRRVWKAADDVRARLDEEMRQRVEEFTEQTDAAFAAAAPGDLDEVSEDAKRRAQELRDRIVADELKAYDVKDER